MKTLNIITDDGISVRKVGDITTVTGEIGGYKCVGGEEYFYYSTVAEVDDQDKILFENRVREVLRAVSKLEEVL
ncbi:hypothetical protein VPHG_00018 [Vibrio phage 11895-B1]|uniref:hypothetical protein n=1 Tax=Vibrio phage 11895-B1 TaxID=754075 RepID=UPI0002C1314A|nr:hypothetical protein VPHG_00018 [Vibrio phage 11895-B1]AGH32085.1 hypothetical protein VPHG_00018 [Vibrio phage 11895-B1]